MTKLKSVGQCSMRGSSGGCCRWSRRLGVEVDLWNLPRRLCRLKVGWVLFIASPSRIEAVRELKHIGVVILERVVVSLAFDSDTIFGSSQLILETQEIFI